MRKLENVTLLCLDTRDPDGAVWAMQKCMSDLQFAEVVLLTHDAYKTADARIMVKPVEMLRNIDDYSRFMVKDIGNYFATSHVLVVQWDGFIVNPELWDNDFLIYDYIGAPWVRHRHAVGNGGFSLRSRKLVDALQDQEITAFNPEDYAICDRYHDFLVEHYGIRFAPVDVAHRFSCETNRPPGPTFGVHGLGSLHWVMSDEAHIAQLKTVPNRQLLGATGRTLIKDCINTEKPMSASYILSVWWSQGTLSQKLDACKLKLKLMLGLKTNLVSSEGAHGAQTRIKRLFKNHIQRGLILLLTGQAALRKQVVPADAKKILWCYDWYRLGDCLISEAEQKDLVSLYQIDLCISGGPIELFESAPLFQQIYRRIEDCPKDYDIILLNDINSRSIRMKIKHFFLKPWMVIIQDLEADDYTNVAFTAQRVQALFGQGRGL